MITPAQVRAWIEQSEADLLAARTDADGLRECHRRYWIQQSYEKAIKAYALMQWTGSDEEEAQFARLFLLQHSPLTHVQGTGTPLSKPLHLLTRQVLTFVRGLDNGALLLKIDGTTPRNDPSEISYRYPFLAEDAYVAPASFEDWDGYQGNMAGVRAAVARLLTEVKAELKIFARTPK